MTIADTPAASKAVLPDRLGRLRVGEGFLEPGGLASAEPAAWETALCEMETRLQQLEAENGELRETCAELERTGVAYAKLRQFAAVGFVTLDPQGTILNVNRAAAVLLGRNKSQLRHRPFASHLSPDDLLRFLAQVRRCGRSRQLVADEFVLSARHDQPRLVQLSIAPVLDGRRQVKRLEAVLIDMTDRRQSAEALHRAYSELELRVLERTAQLARSNEQLQMEISTRNRTQEELAESGRRFRQLAENIGEVFWMTDTEKQQMLYISPGYEQIWGRSCESLYQSPHSWLEAIHPEDRERVREASLTRQLSGDYSEEYRIIRPDRSIRWILDRAFPIRDESGRVYRVTGIAEDITARMEAQEILRESESRFRALFESMPIGIAVHDARGHITQTNLAYQKMLGYSEDELRQLGAKRVTHPDDVAEG
jgi:PAS domain S-box-containing protein